MDKCLFCGSQTALYVMDKPICLNCADDKDVWKEPTTTNEAGDAPDTQASPLAN
jgi:hypothetical protein